MGLDMMQGGMFRCPSHPGDGERGLICLCEGLLVRAQKFWAHISHDSSSKLAERDKSLTATMEGAKAYGIFSQFVVCRSVPYSSRRPHAGTTIGVCSCYLRCHITRRSPPTSHPHDYHLGPIQEHRWRPALCIGEWGNNVVIRPAPQSLMLLSCCWACSPRRR